MIVKTAEDGCCVITLGVREALVLFAGDGASMLDLHNHLRDWLENELVFDDEHNPNLKSGD